MKLSMHRLFGGSTGCCRGSSTSTMPGYQSRSCSMHCGHMKHHAAVLCAAMFNLLCAALPLDQQCLAVSLGHDCPTRAKHIVAFARWAPTATCCHPKPCCLLYLCNSLCHPLCPPGIWSQIKRAPTATKKRKTFEVPGPAVAGAMPLDARARQIFRYSSRQHLMYIHELRHFAAAAVQHTVRLALPKRAVLHNAIDG